MNPKILIGVAVAGLAIVIGFFGYSGQFFTNDVSGGGLFSSSDTRVVALPIDVQVNSISVLEVNNRAATIEVDFTVANPNAKSVLLNFIKYQLYENEVRVFISEIGEQPGGFVIGSNYYTILSNSSTDITDTITIKNTGNTPELWEALNTDSAKWKILGEALFNLSSMTTGGQNEVTFEYSQP